MSAPMLSPSLPSHFSLLILIHNLNSLPNALSSILHHSYSLSLLTTLCLLLHYTLLPLSLSSFTKFTQYPILPHLLPSLYILISLLHSLPYSPSFGTLSLLPHYPHSLSGLTTLCSLLTSPNSLPHYLIER